MLELNFLPENRNYQLENELKLNKTRRVFKVSLIKKIRNIYIENRMNKLFFFYFLDFYLLLLFFLYRKKNLQKFVTN
jgi:hypothetical protein